MNGEHPAVQKLVRLENAVEVVLSALKAGEYDDGVHPLVGECMEELEDALFTIQESQA